MNESSKASALPGLMRRTSQVDDRDVKLKTLQMQHSISRRIFSQESNPNISSNRESASAAGVTGGGGGGIGGNPVQQITSKISLDNLNNNNSPHSKNLQLEVNTPIIQHSGGEEQIVSKKKQKGIFEEYQERWERNNKRIFRYLITWKVGDNGKIEDQLKLMITYLSIIFIVILFICGFATTFYFHMTNKQNIKDAITSQGMWEGKEKKDKRK